MTLSKVHLSLIGVGLVLLIVAASAYRGAWLLRSRRGRSSREASEELIDRIDTSAWVRESVIVSPDYRRMAYVSRRGDQALVIVNGKEGKPYDDIGAGSLLFSPDGHRVAYVARVGDEQFVVVDGQEGKRYDGIGSMPIFSPDSQRVAYEAQMGSKQLVVVDGSEGERYDGIVYLGGVGIIFDSAESLHYLAMKGNRTYLVEEGIE